MQMSLEKWREYGWLKSEPSSREEIVDLLGIVTRALKDAKVEAISDDLRFQAAFSGNYAIFRILPIYYFPTRIPRILEA